MTLTLVNPGDTFSAQVINQAITVLEQPAGGQELGRYRLEGSGYAASALVNCNLITLSRNTAPVSISIDTADQAATNMAAPGTNFLTMGGAQIFSHSSGITTECKAAGNTTMQY